MLWLARHGETAYNAVRRFQGQSAIGLNERGVEQARALAEEAAGHDVASLWCSPLVRARQTAEIVGERIGLAPIDDARLMETDAGDWTGRLFDDVAAEAPERFADFVAGAADFAFPGGESFATQQDRVCAALEDIRAVGPLPALVVCHRGSMRLALARLRGEAVSLEDVPNGALVAL
jgi:broad specificity phosphatase PhoE